MSSVYGDDEYTKMFNEFSESGSLDKMNPIKWVFCVPDDKAEQILAEEKNELTREAMRKLLFDADSVKTAYDEEEIILLVYPDESFINRTFEALNMESNYVLSPEEAPDGRLELFAISKRTVNDRTHTFRYYAECDDAFTISDDMSDPSTTGGSDIITSGDVVYEIDENDNIISSSDISQADKEEITSDDDQRDNDKSLELFTVGRWRDFYSWAAGITDWANEQSAEASSIEIRAAADENDLTKISTAQTETLDCSINRDGYQPWGNINGCDAVNIRRANTASFIIYSCHSFTSGSDYYVVKTTARTATHYYQDRDALTFRWADNSFNKPGDGSSALGSGSMSGHKDPVNYISGFTKSMTIYASLKEGKPGMLANTPTNVPKETQYSNTMGWNIGGSIVGGAPAMSNLSLNGGASFSETKSFTKKAYEIKNARDMYNPSWVLTYTDGISEGHWHVNGYYKGINPPPQSTENVEFESSWIWEVGKSVWSGAGKTITMNFDFRSQEGFAFGHGRNNFPIYAWNTQEKYPSFLSRHHLTINAPVHFWLSNRIYPFPKAGGSATGADKYLFMIEVDENNTGAMRTGNILFEMTYNGHTEKKTIQVSQASK